MNRKIESPVFDSPPGHLSDIVKEGGACHIRYYRHIFPLFRNAREGMSRSDRGECKSQSVTIRKAVQYRISSFYQILILISPVTTGFG